MSVIEHHKATDTHGLLSSPVVIDLHARMARVEDVVERTRRESAHRDTQIALMKADISSIVSGQNKIFAGINRILWAVALGIIGAATTFVLSGGLVVVTK